MNNGTTINAPAGTGIQCDDRRMCALCSGSIGEEALMAMHRLWHPEHFICNGCKKPIKQTYQIADNIPFCIPCFAARFNPKCAACNETLVDTCLVALEKHWHPKCFKCTMCHKPLPNGEFYTVDNNPYDLDCHWAVRLDKRNERMEIRKVQASNAVMGDF
uniref:LIM zinc-binding domain-containing protein n=1 Tax=Parastrongyloides trichosuri TaxID=131310 RepID=A0A0N4ZSY7_PARTI